MTQTRTLTPEERAFLAAARTATLATLAPDGGARLVPICFVLEGPAHLYTPIDEKPKGVTDPRELARVRDIERRGRVSVIVDRWDEDWSRLAWLRCEGTAAVLDAPADTATPDDRRTIAIAGLRAKYPQYADHDLERRPLIRVAIDRVRSWGDLSGRGTGPAPAAADSGSSSSPARTRPR